MLSTPPAFVLSQDQTLRCREFAKDPKFKDPDTTLHRFRQTRTISFVKEQTNKRSGTALAAPTADPAFVRSTTNIQVWPGLVKTRVPP